METGQGTRYHYGDAGILENKSPTLSYNSHYGSNNCATIRIII